MDNPAAFPRVAPTPRMIRVEYPGAMCHILSHGHRREDIFLNDVDRQDFLDPYS